MTIEQIKAIRAVCDAIVEAVQAAGPQGVGSGVVYSALMQYGISLSQYQSLIAGLETGRKLRNENHCLTAINVLEDSQVS